MERTFKAGATVIGVIVGFLYGEWSVMLEVLIAMSVADYLSGIVASGIEGKLSSKIGARGILKKVMIFLVVSVSHFADRLMGEGNAVMTGATFFYIANELLSIIENAGRSGLPVPDVLSKAVAILTNKSKGGKDDGAGD